jgi:acyl-CoA synthetase (NDP forming)
VTISGGAGILMTDAAAELGLTVPRWDDAWAETMATRLPPFAAVRNPIDITGAIATDQSLLRDAATVALKHPGTDVVMVMIGNLDREEKSVCDLLADVAATSDKPLVVVWAGGSGRPTQILGSRGIPVYPEPLRAMRAVSALVRWSSSQSRTPGHLDEPVAVGGAVTEAADSQERGPVVDEVAAKTLLREFDVPTVPEQEAHDADSAAAAAAEIGFPVVLKLLSTQVAHKSDQGFVRVGLTDSGAVREAAQELLNAARRHQIDDRRLVVQAFVRSSTELILGMRQDPVFGPVIALGLGGVLTEVAADVQVRLPPLTAGDVASMVDGLRYRALLAGARGRTPADLQMLARTVLSFTDLVLARGADFESFEVNPLLIDDTGQPVAVDALAVRRRTGARNSLLTPLTEQDR